MPLDIDRLNALVAVTQILLVAACILATALYVRESHYFSLVIKYWAGSLFFVMALYALDLAQFVRYVDPGFALGTQTLLSCAANVVVLALAWHIKRETKLLRGIPSRAVSGRTLLGYGMLAVLPALFLGVVASKLGNFPGSETPVWATTAAYLYVDLFSFYALLRLAKWLSIYLVSLRRVVALTLAAYAVAQLTLDWPLAVGLVRGQNAIEFAVVTASITMIGKVASTLVVIAASSELSRRIQLRALANSSIAAPGDHADSVEILRRVAVLVVGGSNEEVQPLSQPALDHGVEFSFISGDGGESAKHLADLNELLWSDLAVIVVLGPASAWSKLLVSLFLAQRKDFVLLIHGKARHLIVDRSLEALGGVFWSVEELQSRVRKLIQDHSHWVFDRVLRSPNEFWKHCWAEMTRRQGSSPR